MNTISNSYCSCFSVLFFADGLRRLLFWGVTPVFLARVAISCRYRISLFCVWCRHQKKKSISTRRSPHVVISSLGKSSIVLLFPSLFTNDWFSPWFVMDRDNPTGLSEAYNANARPPGRPSHPTPIKSYVPRCRPSEAMTSTSPCVWCVCNDGHGLQPQDTDEWMMYHTTHYTDRTGWLRVCVPCQQMGMYRYRTNVPKYVLYSKVSSYYGHRTDPIKGNQRLIDTYLLDTPYLQYQMMHRYVCMIGYASSVRRKLWQWLWYHCTCHHIGTTTVDRHK